MTLEFVKMHGLGNDYIYFDCFKQKIENPNELSKKLSDRHFSIGGDGIVLICPSEVADGKMRMFNADGSEGKMCGNAIRCVAKYMYDSGIAKKDVITIETLSGIKTISVTTDWGKVCAARVNMGKAEFVPQNIPVTLKGEKIVAEPYDFGFGEEKITCVSMGNPHCVIFKDEVDDINLLEIGAAYENAEIFPERVNTEFVKVIDRGGELTIRYTKDAVFMTGPCAVAFCGSVEI